MSAQRESPCELVHEKSDPGEIASMLTRRFRNGWRLERIIKHHLLDDPADRSHNLVVYLFRKYYN